MRKFFGTDGIRGVANEFPMTPSMAVRVGQAIAATLDPEIKGIAVGRDPRLSGDMLEAALMAGISSCGSPCFRLGVLPTPAIAYMTRKLRVSAGIVISASHNPMEDNGIKVFGPDGFKLTDQQELALERRLESDHADFPHPVGSRIGYITEIHDAARQYSDFLKGLFIDLDLSGMRITLDCANGATSKIAPFLFQELGAEVLPIHFHPDGLNINHECGAMYPRVLVREVQSSQSAIGFSFDGDGDRVICVDEQGAILTGDYILLSLAKDLKENGRLSHDLLVTTVMSNLGLFKAAGQLGVNVKQTQVGDRYVLEEMMESGAILGGEDSGHIIFLDGEHTTGDGIFIALKLLEVIRRQGRPVSSLEKILRRYPQILTGVPVQSRVDLSMIPEIQQAISEAEEELGEEGRVLVRYSGTQTIVRIMVEGPDPQTTERIAGRITGVVRHRLGK
ncbi:MAG: phosphoglucosamine mutase [bacterium]